MNKTLKSKYETFILIIKDIFEFQNNMFRIEELVKIGS